MLKKYTVSIALLAAFVVPHGAPARAAEPDAVVPAAAAAAQLDWALRLPQQEKIAFRGVISVDRAGGQPGQMLYPAPNVVGLLAAIVTHGIIANSVANGQKTAAEEAADKVLLPYQDVLGGYKHAELMPQALAKTTLGSGKSMLAYGVQPATGWVVESMPVFSMTQDQSALVLDNTVVIYQPGAAAQPRYQNTVRVVSRAKDQADLPAFWNAAQGLQLKEECARLLALSLDIGLAQAAHGAAPANAPFKTFRYLEGKTPMMERAQLVGEQCGRSVVRNLKGWLMSIPVGAAADAESCPAAAASVPG